MSSDSLDMNDYANSTLSFPQKLFILLEIDTSGLIAWASHGMCFRIEDPDKFAEDIVPRYFKQTKLTSFQRQLNLYGFRRLSKGEDQGCYFHPKFQRNRKDLLSEIKRLPVKGSLQTYDQVMAAVHSLPSERFGSKRKQAPHTNTVADSQAEEHAVKRQATEQQNLPSASTAPSMIALAPSSMEINSTYPKMSKLTMNIGFAKFLENQKQNNLNKQIPPPRPEHLLRSQVQRQQQPIPPITEHQRDLLNFPIFSNFASERDDNTKTLTKRSSEASLFTTDDLDLLDFLEPIRHDIDIPSAEDDEYIPTFDEAILQNRLL